MDIHKKEVLRYLGYHSEKIDYLTNQLIDASIEEVKKTTNVNYVYNIFDIEKSNHKVFLKGTSLVFEGNDITNHLLYAKKCAIMAVTLGNFIDQKIRYYSKIDLTKSLIFDAVATTFVESFCNKVEEEIIEFAETHDFHTTYRYSPGYGDFPLSIQPKIIQTLDTQRKIGLAVTDNFILTPRKSVTAVIGLQNNPATLKQNACENCNQNATCTYKKDGDSCGIQKNN
ncbi:vitamin B12 dependent-methionine synthase activation domain-containing protein [Marinisporobacter balticus]|uniref:Cobalamin-dependent methionine synthase-like protein n=1 Tax=Marinisporobacter balticus TaxID=2018667 RepID=A0A4R2KKD0_9FIRM|nr:vitamin B12 dependent-methionine synthase activation domain-containing protein [Marinisporobacter balticus]TCO73784.1 cobalamin-dependent methionine synthase-like protein [Marinisporobacter balticus]